MVTLSTHHTPNPCYNRSLQIFGITLKYRIWTVNHIDDQIFSVRLVSGSPILGTVIATDSTMTPGRTIKACGSRINPDDDAPTLKAVGGLEVAGGMVDVGGGKLFENPGGGKDAREAPDEDGGG